MNIFTRQVFIVFLLSVLSFAAKGQVTSSFKAATTSGCAPLVDSFTSTSTGPITGYFWDFGTGTTSVLKDPSTSFTTAGTYTVTLTVYGPGGPKTSSMIITVYPLPVVSFVASDTAVCPGTPTTFTSTTVGGTPGPISYLWSFGDGFTSTATSPVHTYVATGFYTVTLFATNSMGCVCSLSVARYIHVVTPPTPNFVASTNYLCKVPGTVTFTDMTTGTPPFTYSWDFGDGGTSTAPSPVHTYTATGTFSVTLTITDGKGCTTTVVKTAFITASIMKANFTLPTTACINSGVTFVNTSTPHTSSSWDYGDGGTDITNDGYHVYKTTGTFKVRLIVSDGACADTIIHTIIILPGPTISFTQAPLHPCPPPVSVNFIATAPPGTLITWVFSDGGTGSGASTSHLFSTPGVDTITMTATDPVTGCVSTARRIDTLYDLYHDIIDKPVSGCAPLTVTFKDTAWTFQPNPPYAYPFYSHYYPFPPASYAWTFGDGGTSTGANPSHTYTASGSYETYVTITTVNGCVYKDSLLVLVGDPPIVTVKATPVHVCYGKSIGYKATTVKGPIDEYYWEFGDMGGSAITTNDSINYTDRIPGFFTVTLTPSYHGCKGPPVTVSVIVDSPKSIPKATVLCSPHKRVNFADSSMGDDTRLWIFGDGTTSTAKNPTHDYPSAITYTIKLATYNAKSGCRDTATFYLDLSYPTPDFTATKTSMCPDAIDTFTATMTGGKAIYYVWDSGGRFPYDPTRGDTTGFLGPVITDTFHNPGIYNIQLVVVDQNGCLDTIQKHNYIKVGLPVVNFKATPASGCWPLTVTFTDLSTDVAGFALSKYMWAFGDGGTSTVTTSSVTHTFVSAGTFTTQEIVIDNIGCKDSVALPLVTVWRPHADFRAYQYPCLGDSVQFNNSSTGAVSSFWDFGDGTTSTTTSPWHTYSATGSYTVRLAVTDAHGCKDTAVFAGYISVTQVIASFTMGDSFAICPPLLVNFINTSTGATGYAWDLGDGTTTTTVNPSDLYVAKGYYVVTLVATNPYGCSSVATAHVNLYGYAGSFSYSPLQGCSPLKVHFKALISNVPSITWDYSDGTIGTSSLSDTSDHIYVLPGSYVPKLILSDNTGCQNSSTGVDTIKVDKVYPNFITIPDPVCVNSTVNFKDSSRSFFSTITAWAWTFTNGDVSTTSTTPYFYNTPGSYPVNLTVTDGWGCVDSGKKVIDVFPLPIITVSPDTTICVTDAATLTGYGGVSYTWAPPATLNCTSCNPTKASPSVVTTYTVSGTDIHRCVNTDTVTVFLKTKTVSHVTGDTEICRNTVAQLHDSGGTTYLWIPGTGLSSPTVAEPYASPSFTTRYIVIAKLGSCIPDTGFAWVTIHQLPTVDAGPDQRLVEGSIAQLQAKGTLVEVYSWGDPGTLSCDSCASPQATMSVTTTYVVKVTSDFGCKNSDSVTIHIYCDKSQIFVPNTFTPNGDGQNDIFYPRGIGVSDIKSFRIYNRWGQLLFERTDIKINDASNAWDGSYLGGMPKPDVYVWVLDAICETGEPINIKGDVTIIR
jgi:gliding motility-associated-like protein